MVPVVLRASARTYTERASRHACEPEPSSVSEHSELHTDAARDAVCSRPPPIESPKQGLEGSIAATTMASPSGPSPSEVRPADRRMSLGKYVKRVSSVFKRDKSAKTTASPAPAPTATAPAQPVVEPPTVGKEHIAQEEVALPIAPQTQQPQPTQSLTTAPITKQLDRNAMQQERARTLFAKYGLTLESHEWIATPAPIPTVQRVEKSIRMRVHRSCHRCGTIYGADKICLQCEHKRCKKCPRYPKKKTPEERQRERERDGAEKPKKKKVLTITTKAGNELAHQPPKQRIRRSCHKCEAPFVPPTATTCEQCQHVRCTKCPRDPAKLTKWPVGYPGDAEPDSDSEVEKQLEKFRRTWRKPRARVRWECEHCHTVFLNGSPQCPGCGHERCDKCTRSPARKVKKGEHFDPIIVAAVEAKLRALRVDTDTTTSGAEAI